jgi:hypothetical protein
MTNDQAKFILSAFRPRGGDSGNPAFADALRMAGDDPALGAWFKASRELDAAVSSKLAAVEPPPELRGAILAGAGVSRRARRGIPAWGWVAGLAAAAAVAVSVLSFHEPVAALPGAPAFASFAIDDMINHRHGSSGEPAATLVSELQTAGAPMPTAGQIDFDRLRETGCRTLSFGGHELVEVCFAREGTVFHLYVMPRGALATDSAARGASFLSEAGGSAAVWSDGRFDYALASQAGVAALRRLL